MIHFMVKMRYSFGATICAAVLLLFSPLPRGTSWATDCVDLKVKPVRLRHVCGTVTYFVDNETIPGATVTILKNGMELATTQANKDGRFSFERLEAGSYDIRVESPGYQTGLVSIVLVKPVASCKRILRIGLNLPVGCGTAFKLIKP
jgi:Carboxypeptidase regulatory-like domain